MMAENGVKKSFVLAAKVRVTNAQAVGRESYNIYRRRVLRMPNMQGTHSDGLGASVTSLGAG